MTTKDPSPSVVFIMGPPGSGKGTQVAALKKEFGFEGIDTGSTLRALSKEDSPIGRRLKASMNAGRLVSTPLVTELITSGVFRLLREGTSVALEGSPRTLHEAEIILVALRAQDPQNILVVFLDVPKSQTVGRILERWICEGCKRSIPVPPNTAASCGDCGGKLVRRSDDTVEVAEKRWEEYTFRTLPVVHFFERHGLVSRVDGNRPIPDVTKDVLQIVRRRLFDR